MKTFSVDLEHLPAPDSLTSRFRRHPITWKGRAITDLTQGIFKCYLFPVYSPSGISMTSESPVDHPHHNSVTVGADVFFLRLPALSPGLSPLDEEATYNLYVNQVFQGRAPGRTWVVSQDAEEVFDDHLRVVQGIEWQGPEEWGPIGTRRVLARETRTFDIFPGEVANVIDVRSQLRPTEWDITIGPTRHAFFVIRLSAALSVAQGGTVVDSTGRLGAEAITGQTADWVDMSGPAGHGQTAGITVIPHPSAADVPWYVHDSGPITVNPFLRKKGILNRGDTLDMTIRLIIHDGDPQEAGVPEMFRTFKQGRS